MSAVYSQTMSPSPILNGMATRQDPEFYMTLVTFQVEDCLFRVPNHTLTKQSKFFEEMLQYVTSDNNHPIPLDGVTADEFRRLLRVLYPSSSDVKHDADDWLCVLKLGRLWKFDGLCKQAAEQLPYEKVQKSAVEKVALAFTHDLDEWLVPGLNDLARRSEPISTKDVDLLGLERALKVAAVRESITYGPRNPRSSMQVTSGTRNAENIDFTKTIREVFDLKDELPPPFMWEGARAAPSIRACGAPSTAYPELAEY